MSRKKNRERAKTKIFRDGKYISIKAIKEAKENETLRGLGLVRGGVNIIIPKKGTK